MGIMVYSLYWVMQDLYHQPYVHEGSFRVGLRMNELPREPNSP